MVIQHVGAHTEVSSSHQANATNEHHTKSFIWIANVCGLLRLREIAILLSDEAILVGL